MNAWPALITVAVRSVFRPRIGRNRAFNRPWSYSSWLFAYFSVLCHARGNRSSIAPWLHGHDCQRWSQGSAGAGVVCRTNRNANRAWGLELNTAGNPDGVNAPAAPSPARAVPRGVMGFRG